MKKVIAFMILVFFAAKTVDLMLQLLVILSGIVVASVVFLIALAHHDLKKEAERDLRVH